MSAQTRREQRIIQRESTDLAGKFAAQLIELKGNSSDVKLDSATINDFITDSETKVPENLQVVFDEVGAKDSAFITKAILDGISNYEREHGVTPPADIIEHALHGAFGTSAYARRMLPALDSATNLHADNLSLQPNRAIVAILAALSEAIPFAHYLPADIGSNEAKLAILSHLAGVQHGLYAANGLMDGIASGNPYITSSRVHATTNAAGSHQGQLTSVQTGLETCAAVGGASVAVKLLRGRTQVYVNGQVVAREVSNNQTGSGASTISGSVTLSGTTYQIGGTVNTDTGVIAITSTPALSNAIPMVVEGFIDYERQSEIIPTIVTNVDTFSLWAKPWQVNTQHTIGSQTQMSNELGLDPYSESLIAIQNQFSNERHYEVLAKAMRIAKYTGNVGAFSMDWATQGAQKTRSDILQDLQSVLGQVSQQMAINTLSYGISHLYCNKTFASQLQSMPSSIFQSSGIQARAGIYRVGRLFGQYDVYYTPKIVAETVGSAEILAIGRASDVTRNPFVLGDAVPPTIIPLGVGLDLKRGAGFYARNFTEVNPHAPSSMGCALINITNTGI